MKAAVTAVRNVLEPVQRAAFVCVYFSQAQQVSSCRRKLGKSDILRHEASLVAHALASRCPWELGEVHSAFMDAARQQRAANTEPHADCGQCQAARCPQTCLQKVYYRCPCRCVLRETERASDAGFR